MFALTREPIDPNWAADHCRNPHAGALVTFEGVVRDHNEGQAVAGLEYECYEELALAEGTRIVNEALARFDITHAACVHRAGTLAIGDTAVLVCASAAHRGDAFAACEYIIDTVKQHVPIWKKEHYTAGGAAWIETEPGAEPRT